MEQNGKNEINEVDKSALAAFLEEIKADYENYGPQFRTALDKFAKRYHACIKINVYSSPMFFSLRY